MILGRVIGNVVATMKNDSLRGMKFLVVQPLDRQGRDKGKPLVALDSVGAGAGEMVYWCRGKEASFPFLPANVPTEATIVGIVDTLNIPSAKNPATKESV
jgi:microcompartment protein CcmK/EutM